MPLEEGISQTDRWFLDLRKHSERYGDSAYVVQAITRTLGGISRDVAHLLKN